MHYRYYALRNVNFVYVSEYTFEHSVALFYMYFVIAQL